MILIYLQTGAPGEGDEALADVSDDANVFFRTTRGYSSPESGAEVVYTDDPSIQNDYEAGGAVVKTLSGELLSGTDVEDTVIGATETYDELYERAQELDIEGRSHMDKNELRQAIRNA